MNSANGRPESSGFTGPERLAGREGPGVRPGRRRFRPAVDGLEQRQLLTSSTLGTIASFNGTNGALVSGLVQDGQGNLYGTTSSDGEGSGHGVGRVFEIAHGSNAVTTLASFKGSEGFDISGVVLDGQGNFYGTTQAGGANGVGRVFEIAHGSNAVTTIASFDGTNGRYPTGVVVDGQGNLYGTTQAGGINGVGTVFEVARGSNAVTTIASFDNGASGPHGVVVDGQGNLYGTTRAGGVDGGTGTVFEIARGSNAVTTLASFDGLNGFGLSGVTVDGQGNLYGTTVDGGPYSDGTVFEIASGSNTVTTLASFDGTNGSIPDPRAGVVEDGQGNLYGTTESGGAYSDGTVFEIARGSNAVTTLASINGTTGALVRGAMLDGQGHFYATAAGTGNVDGRVFKLTIKQPAR